MKTRSLFFLITAVLGLNFSHAAEMIERCTQTETNQYQSFNRYHFKISKKKYQLSDFFEIDSEDTYRGTVKKSKFRLRNCYDLSDTDGWCATGIRRMFSLGSFFDWGAEIDVYGTQGEWLGMIEGKVLTTAMARFHIYDRYENLVGVAFVDNTGRGVTITKPGNETYALAKFERRFETDIEDTWKAIVYEPAALDDRLIRIFAAFCLDVQDRFHKDK